MYTHQAVSKALPSAFASAIKNRLLTSPVSPDPEYKRLNLTMNLGTLEYFEHPIVSLQDSDIKKIVNFLISLLSIQ